MTENYLKVARPTFYEGNRIFFLLCQDLDTLPTPYTDELYWHTQYKTENNMNRFIRTNP